MDNVLLGLVVALFFFSLFAYVALDDNLCACLKRARNFLAIANRNTKTAGH